MKYVIPAAIAIGVGLVTLASYLVDLPLLMTVRMALTGWAAVLAGLAVLVGALNLLLVHARRVQSSDRGWVYSFLTMLATLLTLGVGVLENYRASGVALYREASITSVLFNGIIVASLATLSGLVMFFLVVAAIRLMKNKPNIWSALFLAALVITLIGWIPLWTLIPFNSFRQWVISVPAAAGARGILLGVALGTLVVGLRVLMGVERPYKD